jgi:transcriptional regulator of arginine metabolism
MKMERQAQILRIIRSKDIETQEELTEELFKVGIEVTQATVSRDIKEMRLTKVLSGKGKYKYISPQEQTVNLSERMLAVFRESVVSIDHADNLIVVKTIAAGAQAAASAIDAMQLDEVVGVIAGDDTILVVVRKKDLVDRLLKRFNRMLSDGTA